MEKHPPAFQNGFEVTINNIRLIGKEDFPHLIIPFGRGRLGAQCVKMKKVGAPLIATKRARIR